MRVIRHNDPGFEEHLKQAAVASSLFDPVVEERTRSIIEAVRTRGNAALLEFTERFDGVKLTADGMAITSAELMDAALAADDSLRAVVQDASRNIAMFARRSKRKPWSAINSHGGQVAEKFDPFQRVGIYIPGGTAPLVSSALMTITLARVAGCPEIVVCTPPGRDGTVNQALLFAARAAGATEILRAGGAQAVAAMALGTETIRPVQKVFGPGNAYVVAAKRLLFGRVAVDLLPGPSEVLVLADDSADPAFAAADLLAQAEHGSGHERVWLVSDSSRVLAAVKKEIVRQLPGLKRRDFIGKILEENTWLIQVRDLRQGVEVVNRLAPEHCEVMTRNARKVSEGILAAGAIFLGPHSPTVLGDYVAGPSHELPTGGAAASFAGLTVDQFQRRTSVVEYSAAAVRRAIPGVRAFAAMEGLDAHGQSAEIRLGRNAKISAQPGVRAAKQPRSRKS